MPLFYCSFSVYFFLMFMIYSWLICFVMRRTLWKAFACLPTPHVSIELLSYIFTKEKRQNKRQKRLLRKTRKKKKQCLKWRFSKNTKNPQTLEPFSVLLRYSLCYWSLTMGNLNSAPPACFQDASPLTWTHTSAPAAPWDQGEALADLWTGIW